MKAQTMSGKKNERTWSGQQISSLSRVELGIGGAEHPQSLRRMKMKTCHGSPPCTHTTHIPLLPRARVAGQWQLVMVDLKIAITNIHSKGEEMPALLYPNVFFF